MKSRSMALICSISLLVITLSGISHAETLCVQPAGYCNALRVRTDTIGTATKGDFRVWGHEYGCGYNDREVSGSLRIKNGIWYIGLTETAGSGAPATGGVFTFSIAATYNPKTGSGTFKMGIVDFGGYVGQNVLTFKKVACPTGSAEPEVTAPDMIQDYQE